MEIEIDLRRDGKLPIEYAKQLTRVEPTVREEYNKYIDNLFKSGDLVGISLKKTETSSVAMKLFDHKDFEGLKESLNLDLEIESVDYKPNAMKCIINFTLAGETGHFTVLITGGIEQAIILAAGDAYHAVRPKTVFQPPVAGVWVTVLGNECLGFALLSWFGASKCAGMHDCCVGFKCVPGQKTGSIFEPIDFVGGVLVGVALAADLRR